ncbi:hypothetical protein D3C74_315500 [compost metagenome]
MAFHDFLYNSFKLAILTLVYNVRHIDTLVRAVSRHLQHFETINFLEFFFLGFRCTGHTCQFAIHPEIVLERNSRERHALVLNLNSFLRFDRLMQTVTIAATRH